MEQLDTAARALARARRLVVFTGAGVSAESGIRTFREKDTGLWSEYDPMDMATLEGYLKDPPLVWSWYEYRFGTIRTAEPNPGHRAIAELEGVLPEVVVVTQNIDGLHQCAGSSDVIELHGTMHSFSCLHKRHTGFTQDDIDRQDERPPRCPECGELLRPEVVWFGEALPHDAYERALELSARCDAMLVVGTSGGRVSGGGAAAAGAVRQRRRHRRQSRAERALSDRDRLPARQGRRGAAAARREGAAAQGALTRGASA